MIGSVHLVKLSHLFSLLFSTVTHSLCVCVCKIYLFMAALGLRCCARTSSSRGEQGLLFNVSVQSSYCGGFSR